MPPTPLVSPVEAAAIGVVVRGTDGIFKVWREGEWESLAVPPAPQAATFPGPHAPGYFSAPEEQEARQTAQRLDIAPFHKRYSLEKIVTQVQAKLPAALGSDASRVLRLGLLTFLRGTRSAIDFSALLAKSAADGGVGLDADSARLVVALASAIGAKITAEGGEVIDEKKEAVQKLLSAPAAAPAIRPRPAPPPAVSAVPPVPAPRPTRPPVAPMRLRPSAARPNVGDVQPAPRTVEHRLVNPVDELRLLDLVTFRTLGPTPAEQATQVVNKVRALAKESLQRRTEGLTAWRASEVYRIYHEIGTQSIHTGQSVTVITAARFRDGLPTLTEAEFNAVADCNQQLRF